MPGYVANADALKAKGVDEIWCISVNDAFVMGAWGRDQKADRHRAHDGRRQRRLHKALGLDADFCKHGMGTRSQRYSMLVEDGVVKQLNVEAGQASKCRTPKRCSRNWAIRRSRAAGALLNATRRTALSDSRFCS